MFKKRLNDRLMGIDVSTHSIAFCVYDEKPVYWGKVDIEVGEQHARCGDVMKKMLHLMQAFNPGHVAIESIIYVNNRDVVIKLAEVAGVIKGCASMQERLFSEIRPSQWMSIVGTPTRDTNEAKDKVKKDHPGKSATWYKNKMRELRKQKTRDWVRETFDIDIDDDDVTDAIALTYAVKKEML